MFFKINEGAGRPSWGIIPVGSLGGDSAYATAVNKQNTTLINITTLQIFSVLIIIKSAFYVIDVDIKRLAFFFRARTKIHINAKLSFKWI